MSALEERLSSKGRCGVKRVGYSLGKQSHGKGVVHSQRHKY
jgi:hypothetical protein